MPAGSLPARGVPGPCREARRFGFGGAVGSPAEWTSQRNRHTELDGLAPARPAPKAFPDTLGAGGESATRSPHADCAKLKDPAGPAANCPPACQGFARLLANRAT